MKRAPAKAPKKEPKPKADKLCAAIGQDCTREVQRKNLCAFHMDGYPGTDWDRATVSSADALCGREFSYIAADRIGPPNAERAA